MKYTIERDNFSFSFNKSASPVIEIKSGDKVVFKTLDAHNGTVPKGIDVVFPDIDIDSANPIVGPVKILDSKPGDILRIKIKDIKLDSYGFIPARENIGIIKGLATKNIARNIKIEKGLLYFSEKIKMPVRPMIGTIGVAPEGEEVYSVFPGAHGGNMDNNDIRVGSIVYLPVFAEGALLSIGDIHAAMGDGELTSGGIDINSEVTLKIELIKNSKIARPIIETDDFFIVTSNAPGFYEANRIAVLEMLNLLMKGLEVTRLEAYWLIGLYGDLKISQACDSPIDITLRLSFPKTKGLLKWKKIF